MTDALDLADRLLDALDRYDVDAVASLLAPDMVRWINIGQREMDGAATLAHVELEGRIMAESKLKVRQQLATDEGFVAQIVVEGTTKGGVAFSVPACLVVAVRDGLVTRIDEYADLEAAKPLLEEMYAG